MTLKVFSSLTFHEAQQEGEQNFRKWLHHTKLTLSVYGQRNGAKFTKFIFIYIQCCYCYSRIYLFTFNNQIYIQEIYLFTFTGVFLIHYYICSHLRDVFIHIHDRNIHSAFSVHHLCASLASSSRSTISERSMADGG